MAMLSNDPADASTDGNLATVVLGWPERVGTGADKPASYGWRVYKHSAQDIYSELLGTSSHLAWTELKFDFKQRNDAPNRSY